MPLSIVVSVVGLAYWIISVAAVGAQNRDDLIYLRDQRHEFEIRLSEKLDEQSKAISELKAGVSSVDAKLSVMRELQVQQLKKDE